MFEQQFRLNVWGLFGLSDEMIESRKRNFA
jgi:hypothetical protein